MGKARFAPGANQQRRIIALRRIVAHLATLPPVEMQPKTLDIYQFGVYLGFGLRAWMDSMPLLNISTEGRQVFGFDSFRGMPDEAPGFMRTSHVKDAQWHAGGLNAAVVAGKSDWPSLQAQLVRNINFDPERTHFIRGFYNESLTEGPVLARRRRMRPAFLLDIDCDLYTSTVQAMRFMLESGLLVPGSFVYYDDYSVEAWRISNKSHPFKEERLAHEEIRSEFGLKWKPLFTHRFAGPLQGVDWITQFATNGTRLQARPVGELLSPRDMTPVLQLISCAKCQRR